MTRVGFKLVRKRKDGTFGPLFINARLRIPQYEWIDAECHPTKGFKVRPGWHICDTPVAPHLNKKGRVWMQVHFKDYETIKRPESQGGIWYIAKKIFFTQEMYNV